MTDSHAKPTVLVVDDVKDNLRLFERLLHAQYRVDCCADGAQALVRVQGAHPPSLVLLDVRMPGMDGYEVCRRLKADPSTADIPVLFLTALNSDHDEAYGLQLGAEGFIEKPVHSAVLKARVRTHLRVKQARDWLKDENTLLEAKVAVRTRRLERLQEATPAAMGALAETRDHATGEHIRRTRDYVRILAAALSRDARYADALQPPAVELIAKSAALHDIGMAGVPDSILRKPGLLTDAESEVMKRHTVLGRDAIAGAEALLDEPESLLRYAREIAYSHHERWDGRGYPEGLEAEQIPLAARIMAVADVYDALTTRRVYKPAFPHEYAMQVIMEGRGALFDPALVDAFLETHGRFQAVAESAAETEASAPADIAAPAEVLALRSPFCEPRAQRMLVGVARPKQWRPGLTV